MAIKTGSLGPLLQGVSQQPARIRLEGQVTEQINLESDVTQGLSTRPSSFEVSNIETQRDTKFRDISLSGVDYLLEYTGDYLRAYLMDGTSIPVWFEGEATASYIGESMRFIVVDGKILMVNREKVVELLPAITPPNYRSAVISCMAGEFSKPYRVAINFSDGSVVEVVENTPNGSGDGDGVRATTEYIANNLAILIRAHPNKPAALEVDNRSGYIMLYHPNLSMRVTVSDGAGGENLKVVTDVVKTTADLPKYAPNGMLVQVKVGNKTKDNYWLKYNATDITVENGQAGFYREGIWEESRNPYIPEAFNLSTMPHVIRREENSLVVSTGEWIPRQVGDEVSAPVPSIVGKRIRDLGGFESRTVLLTDDTVVMSRTNYPYDLWRESATVISDSDPIDMTSTKKNELRFDWIVPFDRDLFLVADPGDSQFVIRGGGVTPNNASLVLTTEYEVESAGVAPPSTGRTLLLPFKVGRYSGLQEYYTNSENSVQAANSLTETVNMYIEGTVKGMSVSQNFNMAVITTDSTDPVFRRTLWVYKYLWDGSELIQSSWSKWRLRSAIRYHFFKSNRLYVILDNETGSAIEYLDLNRVPGEYGYAPSLDSYREAQVTLGEGYSEFRSSLSGIKFIQHRGCRNPGLSVEPARTRRVGNETLYEFDTSIVPVGAMVISGIPIVWELYPTEVYARDYQGRIDTSKNLVVQEYVVKVQDSGVVKADFISPYSPTYTYFEELAPMDQEPLYPQGSWLVSEDLVFPWGERADWSTLRLWGDDYRPVTINEVQWAGQITAPRGTRA